MRGIVDLAALAAMRLHFTIFVFVAGAIGDRGRSKQIEKIFQTNSQHMRGFMKILPDIYRVDGIRGVNSYLVVSAEGITIVDTGMPAQAARILDAIRTIGKKPEDVKWIVLTHADLDHSGSAAQLREHTGAKIAAHTLEAQVLKGERPGKQPKGILRLGIGILGLFLPVRSPFSVDTLLKDGDAIAGWKVVHTPGHTEGSICLYRPGGALFVGDAMRCDKNGNPQPPSSAMSGNMRLAFQSIQIIADLDFESLLPGHGAPCLQGASQKVAALLSALVQ